MDDLEKGANWESPAQNKGAGAGSPPDSNVIGEFLRKNGFYDLKDSIEELKETISEMKSKGQNTDKQEDKLDKMDDDMDELVNRVFSQEKTDKNTKGFMGAVRKLISQELGGVKKTVDDINNEKRTMDFDSRDEFLAEKAKEHGMTIRELKKVLGEYIEIPTTALGESKWAYKNWIREKTNIERESKLKESEDKIKSLRENGGREFDQNRKKSEDFAGSNWKNSKTRDEKIAALADI